MRRQHAILILVVLLFLGCQQPEGPVRREVLGTWQSRDLQGVIVRMTVSETARSIDGAGAWLEAEASYPFRVFGALARDEVSLYFDFSDRADLSFQGFFRTADRMEGVLVGGGFRDRGIAFERESLPR